MPALVNSLSMQVDLLVQRLSKEEYAAEVEALFVFASDLFHHRADDWDGNHEPEPAEETP